MAQEDRDFRVESAQAVQDLSQNLSHQLKTNQRLRNQMQVAANEQAAVHQRQEQNLQQLELEAGVKLIRAEEECSALEQERLLVIARMHDWAAKSEATTEQAAQYEQKLSWAQENAAQLRQDLARSTQQFSLEAEEVSQLRACLEQAHACEARWQFNASGEETSVAPFHCQ